MVVRTGFFHLLLSPPRSFAWFALVAGQWGFVWFSQHWASDNKAREPQKRFNSYSGFGFLVAETSTESSPLLRGDSDVAVGSRRCRGRSGLRPLRRDPGRGAGATSSGDRFGAVGRVGV